MKRGKLGGQVFGGEAGAGKKKRGGKARGGTEAFVEAQVEDIWKRIGTGEIALGLAVVYVTYGECRPVYDEDVLTVLLLNYGYRIDSVLAFIDQFICSELKPVVVMHEKKSWIYSEVKPLKGIPKPGK